MGAGEWGGGGGEATADHPLLALSSGRLGPSPVTTTQVSGGGWGAGAAPHVTQELP